MLRTLHLPQLPRWLSEVMLYEGGELQVRVDVLLTHGDHACEASLHSCDLIPRDAAVTLHRLLLPLLGFSEVLGNTGHGKVLLERDGEPKTCSTFGAPEAHQRNVLQHIQQTGFTEGVSTG